MVCSLDDDGIDGIDGDNDVDSPTGGDGILDENEIDEVDPPTGGDETRDGFDDADEIKTVEDGSIWGVMLSGVELGSWTRVVPLKAPEFFNGTPIFPTWASWDT